MQRIYCFLLLAGSKYAKLLQQFVNRRMYLRLSIAGHLAGSIKGWLFGRRCLDYDSKVGI